MSMFGNFCLGSESATAGAQTVGSTEARISPGPASADDVLPCHFNPSRRASVSAECSMPNEPDSRKLPSQKGSFNSEEPTSAPQLRQSLRRIFLFSDLADSALNIVLNSLICKQERAGTTVIQQGDEGDYFYIIQNGEVDYYVDGKLAGRGGPGASFGEIALLYNSPRSASVKTVTDCTFWLLDRATFKHIMRSKRSDKREHSRLVLSQIELFATLPIQSQLKIADALQPVSFESGVEVFHEGDPGEYFYIVDEGTIDISAKGEHLATQGSGSYFGELALIYDHPRAATITAVTNLKLERLTKQGFERLIGPEVVEELRRRDPTVHMDTTKSPLQSNVLNTSIVS